MKVSDADHDAAKQAVDRLIHEIETLEGEGKFRLCDASRYYGVFLDGVKHALASRPPAPAWTSEPPKVPGWYGFEYDDNRGVEFAYFDDHDIKLKAISGHDPFSDVRVWYGPIPEPPEPTREEQP